jgi:replicative DNA helicase
MFLYRPEYYGLQNNEMGEAVEGETHIHIAKHRNGSTGEVKVRFIKEYQKFVDMEDDQFDAYRPAGNSGGDPSGFSGGSGGSNHGGGNLGNGGGGNNFAGQRDNPSAGIRRDTSGFGDSKLFIPGGGFQTKQSKANDMNWEDDDLMGGGNTKLPTKPDEDAPF